MTNVPLPIPVERLISTADLDPSPADLMMAAGGVSLENPTDAATAYPHLWATRNAAKKAMEKRREGRLGSNRNKDSLITERPQPPFEVSYQRAGPGCSKATAYVDLTIVPGPEAWLTERLGPLANFALGPEPRGCCGAIAPRNPGRIRGGSRPCVAISTFGAASRPVRRVPGSSSPGWSGFWAADLGHPRAHLRPFTVIAPNMITPALDRSNEAGRTKPR